MVATVQYNFNNLQFFPSHLCEPNYDLGMTIAHVG